MDTKLRERFAQLWSRYFNGADLPICLFHSDDATWAERLHPAKGYRCMVVVAYSWRQKRCKR
jgi:hypothetical protein